MGAAVPWLVALITLIVLAGLVVWMSQRETAWRAGQARAEQAEARAATAEAALAAVVQAQAATATALAQAASPEAAVDRSLRLLLAADREPTETRLRALSDAFGPAALAVVRPEVEHLLSGGLHLSAESGYQLSVLDTSQPAPDEAEVRTHERWLYDERGADDQRVRCLVETSDQTYSLQRAGPQWQVTAIQLGTSSRSTC